MDFRDAMYLKSIPEAEWVVVGAEGSAFRVARLLKQKKAKANKKIRQNEQTHYKNSQKHAVKNPNFILFHFQIYQILHNVHWALGYSGLLEWRSVYTSATYFVSPSPGPKNENEFNELNSSVKIPTVEDTYL